MPPPPSSNDFDIQRIGRAAVDEDFDDDEDMDLDPSQQLLSDMAMHSDRVHSDQVEEEFVEDVEEMEEGYAQEYQEEYQVAAPEGLSTILEVTEDEDEEDGEGEVRMLSDVEEGDEEEGEKEDEIMQEDDEVHSEGISDVENISEGRGTPKAELLVAPASEQETASSPIKAASVDGATSNLHDTHLGETRVYEDTEATSVLEGSQTQKDEVFTQPQHSQATVVTSVVSGERSFTSDGGQLVETITEEVATEHATAIISTTAVTATEPVSPSGLLSQAEISSAEVAPEASTVIAELPSSPPASQHKSSPPSRRVNHVRRVSKSSVEPPATQMTTRRMSLRSASREPVVPSSQAQQLRMSTIATQEIIEEEAEPDPVPELEDKEASSESEASDSEDSGSSDSEDEDPSTIAARISLNGPIDRNLYESIESPGKPPTKMHNLRSRTRSPSIDRTGSAIAAQMSLALPLQASSKLRSSFRASIKPVSAVPKRSASTPDKTKAITAAATDSPSTPQATTPSTPQPETARRATLTKSLRTTLPTYTPLKTLRFHLQRKLDVLAIAVSSSTEPIRAKAGPKDWSTKFWITDPSLTPGAGGRVEVSVFRPYRSALPSVERGEAVLLRAVTSRAVKGGWGLRSEEGSAWVVWKLGGGDGEEEGVDSGVGGPETNGPPVEYDGKEVEHLRALREWYDSLDDTVRGRLEAVPQTPGTPGQANGKVNGSGGAKANGYAVSNGSPVTRTRRA
jgi:hypothetical protein